MSQLTVTFELLCLIASVFLGLIYLSAASFSYKAQVGNRHTVGPRDTDPKPEGLAGRLSRAFSNFLETFSFFAACVLVVHLAGASGEFSYWGCVLYLVGRALYLPLYALGIPWMRTLAWNFATLGVVLVGFQVIAASLLQ